jgi:chromosome segregation ATPase
MDFFRNEREILSAISLLRSELAVERNRVTALTVRVKTLEDRGGSVDTTLHAKLDLLLQQQALLLQQGVNIMGSQAAAEQVLAEINAATNEMAEDLTTASSKITEIDADLDALLTRPAGEPISDALLARFQQHRDTLNAVKADLDSKATALTATAAKFTPEATGGGDTCGGTTEPPVEEPPVEEPPTPATV